VIIAISGDIKFCNVIQNKETRKRKIGVPDFQMTLVQLKREKENILQEPL